MILGPCRCQGCGQLVYWARVWERFSSGDTGYAWVRAWRNRDGTRHACAVSS